MTVDNLPVVMLSGLLCDSALWRAQANALASFAKPIVADLTHDDTLMGMAQRVLSLAPERFALVGLSMGGYVALEIMRQAPERVVKLALFSTSARPDSVDRARLRREAIECLPSGRFIGVSKSLLPKLIHRSLLDGPVAEEVYSMAMRVGEAAFRRQQNAIMLRPDLRGVLERINVPTLVGVGDSDLITPPEEAVFIRDGISRAHLHVFRNCGHLPPLERPDQMSDLLRGWVAAEAKPLALT
jgi:pimeloyl-ACP methyl ester carboxylesterase